MKPHERRALIYFFAGLVALSFSVWLTRELLDISKVGSAQPTKQGFFVILIPLCLFASLFLFCLMRSYAQLNQQEGSLSITVGGPAAFALILLLVGMRYAPDASTFSLTLSYDPELLSPDVAATVHLYVPQPVPCPLSSTGVCVFTELPVALLETQARLQLTSDRLRFSSGKADTVLVLRPGGQELLLVPRVHERTFRGRVTDEDGRPAGGVTVLCGPHSAKTDSLGFYSIVALAQRPDQPWVLEIRDPRYRPVVQQAGSASAEINLMLHP